MTFEVRELSAFEGEPVELYEFTYSSKAWRYTSADEQQTYLSNVYLPISIRRTNIEQTQEMNRSDLSIEIMRDTELALQFLVYPPAEVMLVRVYLQHRGELETIVGWVGRVLNCEWSGSVASLKCESVFTSMRRVGLRRLYGASCPHVLYGRRCGAVRQDFEDSYVVEFASDNILVCEGVETLAADYLPGGFVEFIDTDGILHRRAIIGQNLNEVTMTAAIRQLTQGDQVTLAPGCKHNLDDCENKFNNLVNYGGFPYSPELNPFDGKTLY